MICLSSQLLAFLRKLCSAVVQGSIKRLLLLFGFVQRRFSMKRPSSDKDSSGVPHSQPNHAIDFPISNVICPSTQPPLRAAVRDTLHVPNEFDEPYTTSIHSPIPTQGYFAYPVPHCSQSSQDMNNLPVNAQNDATSISRRFGRRPSSSLISLPLSHHGHTLNVTSQSVPPRPTSRNSQRPNSRNSQPIKVSRTPSAAPSFDNIAPPAGEIAPPGSRLTSPQELRNLIPISAADIQRWDRKVVMYAVLITYYPS